MSWVCVRQRGSYEQATHPPLPTCNPTSPHHQNSADSLNNRYWLVRAGESYAESFGEPLTNPVWKTSERHGLSPLGKEQVGGCARC
jgi:hypothetical protein